MTEPSAAPSLVRRSRGRRMAVWTWAAVWPLLSFVVVGVGHVAVDRWAPRVVDAAENAAGLGPLSMSYDWPGDSCGGGDAAAFTAPAPSADRWYARHGAAPDTIVASGGAAYESGLLTVQLGATGDATVVVTGLEVVRHRHDSRPLAWAVTPTHECGGGDEDSRDYATDLDARSPRLALVGQDGHDVPATTRFAPFEASAADPTLIHVTARACHGFYEWGVRVTYRIGGKTYRMTIGAAANPLRSAGGPVSTAFGEVDYQRLRAGDPAALFAGDACRPTR